MKKKNNWYSNKYSIKKRKSFLNIFLVLEILVLVITLLSSKNPSELFKNAWNELDKTNIHKIKKI